MGRGLVGRWMVFSLVILSAWAATGCWAGWALAGWGRYILGVSPSGRRVAVKLIHPVHAGTAQFRERFAREIDAARRVGGFHTAPVVDADPHADPPWMVTAYIDGPSLQEAVGPGRAAAGRTRCARSAPGWPRGWPRSTPTAWCTGTSSRAT